MKINHVEKRLAKLVIAGIALLLLPSKASAHLVTTGLGPVYDGIGQLVTQMRREQEIIRQWADEQSSQHGELLSSIRASLENRRPPRRN